MSIDYRLVRASDLDGALVDAWRQVQVGDARFHSPYFCPEFAQAVAQVRDDVQVVVIEDAGRPVGFFPHQRSSFGMGKPVGGWFSDFHGVIVAPARDWRLDALLRAAHMSVWEFHHLVGEEQEILPFASAAERSPQIDLRAGYRRYVQSRQDSGSDYIRKTEGLARKLSRDMAEPVFTLHDADGAVLDRIIEWKSLQFRKANLPDAFSLPWTGALLRRIAQTQTAEFSGVCSVLRIRDRIVAAHMGMRSRNTFHYWFPTYDPEFAKFSPGIILLLRMAEALADTGVETIDLGAGEAQYKERLMTGSIPIRRGAVELPSMLARGRALVRLAENRASRGGAGSLLKIPLGLIRRTERLLRFH